MDPRQVLVKLARQSASTWERVAGQAFRGDASVETANTVYLFRNGVFAGKAPKGTGQQSFDAPASMRSVKLIGFLAYEDGLWSLSTRWRKGSLAVLWNGDGHDERSFLLTSPTSAWALEPPVASADSARRASMSSAARRVPSCPPSYRRPAPPSMTRLHLAAAADLPR